MGRARLGYTPEQRFLDKIIVGSRGGCWLWTETLREGYGRFCMPTNHRPRLAQAHRVSYEMFVGPIPDGLVLDHLCRVRHCVNPRHLEIVTRQENSLRGQGVAGKQARRTHCPKGHLYGGENLRVYDGRRKCRECSNARNRFAYRRRKQMGPMRG